MKPVLTQKLKQIAMILNMVKSSEVFSKIKWQLLSTKKCTNTIYEAYK